MNLDAACDKLVELGEQPGHHLLYRCTTKTSVWTVMSSIKSSLHLLKMVTERSKINFTTWFI